MVSEQSQVSIFVVPNNHSAECGIPPQIEANQLAQYYGYFENEHKEQFIFVYERHKKQGKLWVGDNGWEHPVSITDLEHPNVTLSKSERLWLQACWMAATVFEEK